VVNPHYQLLNLLRRSVSLELFVVFHTLKFLLHQLQSGDSSWCQGASLCVSNVSVSYKPNTAAIVGGVVGGVAFLGILAVLIVFFVVRSKRKPKPQTYESSFQQSSKMPLTSNTTASPSIMSSPAGAPSTLGATSKDLCKLILSHSFS
jgi:hypothetical protein